MWPARAAAAHIAWCTRWASSQKGKKKVQRVEKKTKILFFFSGRKRKKTQIYFSEFSDGTPAVFTGLEHAATSTTAAHKPPKSSHTKWLNDERYSLSSSSFFLSFFLFSLRIESLTRHIYYSISAVKGDGALATTKLVVHQQRGGRARCLLCVCGTPSRQGNERRLYALVYGRGELRSRVWFLIYKKREAARRARGPLAQCEAMKRVPRHTFSFFLFFFHSLRTATVIYTNRHPGL
jgi:hypothetical protein